MNLTRLIIKNLYGSLSRDIRFNEEMNLLVGINGSGKTSVLNIIDWLLAPNLRRLSTTEFERIELFFRYDAIAMRILATQTDKLLTMSLKHPKKRFHPITVNFDVHPSKIPNEVAREELLETYRELYPEPKERPLWNFFQQLPNPVVIALDRSISAEVEDSVYRDPEIRVRQTRATRVRSPIAKVREVTSARHAAYRSQIIELNDSLKAKIVATALSSPGRTNAKGKISLEQIDKLEKKITSYMSTAFRETNISRQIKNYFRSAKKQSRKYSSRRSKDIEWQMFVRQYRQIEEMARALDDYEKNSTLAYESLKRYLNVVNRFLTDSQKAISFNEKTNTLCFKFCTDKGKLQNEFRSIDNLSSGERQILILFTFLAFVSDKSRLFIVDEPELSLHPKWQKEFIEAFLTLKPTATQFLLATHSPEIVGRHKSACIVLRP